MAEKYLKHLDDILIYTFSAIFFLVPLLFSSWSSTFTLPKILFVQSATLLALALWIIKLLFSAEVKIKRGYFDVAVLFLFLLTIASTFFSVFWPVSVFGSLGRYGQSLVAFSNFFLLYFVAAQLDWTARRLKFLFKAAITSATIVSIYGLLQYFGFDPINFAAEFPVRRSFATLGNPNLLGSYLALVLLVSLGFFLTQRDSGKLWGLAAVIIFLALIATFSRGPWLASLIGLIIFVFLYFDKVRSRIVAIICLIAFLLVIFSVIAVYSEDSSKELNPVSRFSELISVQGSAEARLEIWRAAAQMAATRPLLGYGPDTFKLVFPQFQSLRHAQLSPESLPDQAHNSVLQLAATAGLSASLLFITIIGLFIKKIWDEIGRGQKKNERLLYLGMLTAVLSYFMATLTTVSTIEGDVILWTFIGVASAKSSRHWIKAGFPLKKKTKTAIATASIIIILSLAYVVFMPYRAETHFRQGDFFGRRNNLIEAENHFSEALKLNPYVPDYWEGLAKVYSFKRSDSDAESRLEEADFLQQVITKQPYEYAFYIRLAKAYISLGKRSPAYREKAMSVLGQVLKISPNLAKAHYYLGVIYLEKGDINLALQELNQAVLADPYNSEAYYALGYSYERLNRKDKAAEFYQKALRLKPAFVEAKARLVQLSREK